MCVADVVMAVGAAFGVASVVILWVAILVTVVSGVFAANVVI